MIEKCQFGSMLIEKNLYRSDLIIYPDKRVKDNWWRISGHQLMLEDIQDVLDTKPHIIIVGTGIYGRMEVNQEVLDALSGHSIELVVLKTKEAVKEFNRIKQTSKKVAGCFHLTC